MMADWNGLLIPGGFDIETGSMASGKTKEFIDKFDRMGRSNIRYMAFKPIIDDRYPPTIIKSRSSVVELPCIAIPHDRPEAILEYLTKDVKAIGIDELQFFIPRVHNVIEYCRDIGLYVVGTMLELNFRGEPFNETSSLILPYASQTHHSVGACAVPGCSMPGDRTQRFTNGKPSHYTEDVVKIDRGDANNPGVNDDGTPADVSTYEPRCRGHHIVPGKPALYTVSFSPTLDMRLR